MAEQMAYYAQLTLGDRAKKITTFEVRVSATDAKAWFAAADTTARDATAVGVLLDRVFDVVGSSQYKSKNVVGRAENDAFIFPFGEGETYNSNKINVSYSTTLGGLPRNLQVTIPQRDPGSYELESNGINIVLDDADEIAALVTAMEATALSPYGTAMTIVEMTVNDS